MTRMALNGLCGAVGEGVGPADCIGVRSGLVAIATTGDGVPEVALQSIKDAIRADASCISN